MPEAASWTKRVRGVRANAFTIEREQALEMLLVASREALCRD
jgi:hypothetical protein